MQDFKIFINENGKLLTGFLAILIVFGGISAINGEENWWIIPVGILLIGIVSILFINARYFFKLLLSIFITSVLSGYAFQIGTNLNNSDTGTFWMGLMWVNFFAIISITYIKESNESRWTSLLITQSLSFLYFYIFTITTLDIKISLTIGEILTILTFIALYYFPLKNIINTKNMPKQTIPKKVSNQIDKETKEINWKYKILEKEQSILIWGEYNNTNIAFNIIPIKMDQKFGVIGKRKQRLAYKGTSINPWLSKLLYTSVPYWKLRGTTPLPILYDIDSKNGKNSKIIGVKIADKKDPFPFIITPFNNHFIEKIIKEYGDIAIPLKEKQTKSLNELLD